jgi:hypothetical protein
MSFKVWFSLALIAFCDYSSLFKYIMIVSLNGMTRDCVGATFRRLLGVGCNESAQLVQGPWTAVPSRRHPWLPSIHSGCPHLATTGLFSPLSRSVMTATHRLFDRFNTNGLGNLIFGDGTLVTRSLSSPVPVARDEGDISPGSKPRLGDGIKPIRWRFWRSGSWSN